MFIAPRIHPNTIRHFHLNLKHDITPEAGGPITIIPLSLSGFIDFAEFCINHGVFSDTAFRGLLINIEDRGRALADNQADKWKEEISSSIGEWKTQRLQTIGK